MTPARLALPLWASMASCECTMVSKQMCCSERARDSERLRLGSVRTLLSWLNRLVVLDAGERCGEFRRLRIKEGLRTYRQHLNVDIGSRHVLEAALQIPATARKPAINIPGDIERGEPIIHVGELRRHFRCFALQEPDRLFRQDVRVNVDDGLR